MAAIKHITIDQGSDFTKVFSIKTLTDQNLVYDAVTNPWASANLTGYTANLQVRKDFDAVTPDLTGVISLSSGKITVNFPSSSTNALVIHGPRKVYFYDLYLYKDSKAIRIAEGTITVHKAITKPV